MMKPMWDKIFILPIILFVSCFLGFTSVFGAQNSESDIIERANNFSYELENRLRALWSEFYGLGNSTAALARRDSIPLEMENEIQNYQTRMRFLISDTKAENVRAKLGVILEHVLSRSRSSTSQVKTQTTDLSRNVCTENAYKNYRENWANNCRGRGMSGDCSLPAAVARELEENHRRLRHE